MTRGVKITGVAFGRSATLVKEYDHQRCAALGAGAVACPGEVALALKGVDHLVVFRLPPRAMEEFLSAVHTAVRVLCTPNGPPANRSAPEPPRKDHG